MFIYGNWKEILCTLSCIKAECIDNKKIVERLEKTWDYDEEILDNLYFLKIITLDEYIKYLSEISEIKSRNLKAITERISKAKEQGDEFDPSLFYCCCYNPM